MTKYEYMIIDMSRCPGDDDPWDALESRMQAAGKEGWELVCVDSCSLAYLKRTLRPQRSEIDEENINRMTPSKHADETQRERNRT